MKRFRAVLLFIILLPGLIGLHGIAPVNAQTATPDPEISEQVQQLFDQMTPAERVGQLFLISFQGANADLNTNIYTLIHNYHVGGVILMTANNNFSGSPDTINDAYNLISNLQSINRTDISGDTGTENSGLYIPLFIAMSQQGDGYPNDQILSGLTPLPSQMALGATWSPELAASTGEILGRELSALGVNMLLGPSLDVLDLDYSEGNEALGTGSFGESPYWVGKLGQSYIEGIHTGSEGKLMVIASHLPGQGSSDRDPSQEIATVSKTYDTLLNEDITPFLAVTGNAPSTSASADGLLVGSLRYESLQGTIRNTTRPFNLDSNALEQVMSLSALASWRSSGGLLVSDNLGSTAIRNYYDPNDLSFDARQVARNAVFSGMDLLYLDGFVATGDIDQTTTIIRTLELFQQKYLEDSAFAQHVDAAVKRILAKKLALYPDFTESVTPDPAGLESLGNSSAVTFEVAQRAVTLLSPKAEDYANTILSPPGLSDRTVFFTDHQLYKQCSSCLETEMIASDALRRSVIRLYGPDASGDTAQYLLSTFAFTDLLAMLNGEDEGQIVEEELRAADWVVFAFMDTNPSRPASLALKQLLQRRPDLLTGKYSIAFAFGAPYYLDSTEIAKLSAYYAVYSKIPSFTELAARVLFQEITPTGSLPISLPAIGYDLNYAVSPTATQTITLSLDAGALTDMQTQTETPTVEETSIAAPSFRTGDTIPLTTGQIFDHNFHPVPDGTPVTFSFSIDGETDFVQTLVSTTVNGIAKTEFLIPGEGRLEISAYSGEAVNSNKLLLNVSRNEAAVITVIVPTDMPTQTPSPTAAAPTETPIPTLPAPVEAEKDARLTGADWLFAMALIWGLAFGIYTLTKKVYTTRWSMRWALLAAFGGTCAYIYMLIGVFRINHILAMGRFSGNLLGVLIGMGLGWLIGWLWRRNFNKRNRKNGNGAAG